MIIKGKSRSRPIDLAKHLGNAEKNERVTLLETRGTVANDLQGALVEMDAFAIGTKCQKPLYHAAISPEPPHRLTPEQRTEAIDALEAKLGLTGHARVVVMHEKLGRQHIHVVWSRINLDLMRSVSDSHNYRKHEEVARDLERRFGHDRVQGAHHERDGVKRPDRTPSRAELRQEERTGISGREVKAEVTAIFRSSDGPEAFKAALDERGYTLAQGDRRDFIIVDRAGGIHSLARRIDGIKAAELRQFMASLDREKLPTSQEAKLLATERDRKTKELQKSHDEAQLEKSYGRSEDYVTQSAAAQKDFERRTEALNAGPKPMHPDAHDKLSIGSQFDAQGVALVAPSQQSAKGPGRDERLTQDQSMGFPAHGTDFNEYQQKFRDAMKRYQDGDEEVRKLWDDEYRRLAEIERQKKADQNASNPLLSDGSLNFKTERRDHRELGDKVYDRYASELDEGHAGDLARWKDDEERLQKDRDRQNDAQIQGGQREAFGSAKGDPRSPQDEITDRVARRFADMSGKERARDDDDDRDPDRQQQAPGGGRTRSR